MLTVAPTAEEPTTDINALIGRIIEADSFKWQGWGAAEYILLIEAEPKWDSALIRGQRALYLHSFQTSEKCW